MASTARRKTSAFKKFFARKYSRKAAFVSRKEKAAGIVILLLLVGIAAVIHAVGQRASTQTPIVREKGGDKDVSHAGPMVPVEWETSALPANVANAASSTPSTMSTTSPAASPGSLLPTALSNPQWKMDGEAEQFAADNLYEKINGRAEAYISYGFIRLDCASYVAADDENEFIDVFVFDHGQPLHAFGIYASERTPDAPPVAIGREGYNSEGSVFFWKGSKYVQVIPSSDQEETKAFAVELAKAVESNIDDNNDPLPGLNLLPPENMVPSSSQYILKSALSQDFLDKVFTARYSTGANGQALRMFATQRADEAEAKQLLSQYREYLAKYAKPANLSLSGADSASGDMAGTFELVFVKGNFFAGVTEAPSAESAKTAAEKLQAQLK